MLAPPEIDGFGQFGLMHAYCLHLNHYTINLHIYQAKTLLLTVELFRADLGSLHTIQLDAVYLCRINPDGIRLIPAFFIQEGMGNPGTSCIGVSFNV